MVTGTSGDEIVAIGPAPVGPGLHMVEVAIDRAAVAIGEGTSLVAGANVPIEIGFAAP